MLDQRLFTWIYFSRTPVLTDFSTIVSTITNYNGIWLLLIMYYLICGGKHGRQTAFMLITSLAGMVVLSYIILPTFIFRSRPYLVLPGVRPIGETLVANSFPSGHVGSTVAAVVILAAIYPKFRGWAVLITLLVMWSRIYNGMHWPTDTLAGVLIGLIAGSLTLMLFDWRAKQHRLATT